MPLKLWNYKVLENRFYCTPHYEQFRQKIMTKKMMENQKKALDEELKKEELKRQEEERLALEAQMSRSKEEEEKRKKAQEEAELQLKRDELARQAEEMRKMLEAEDAGIPYVPATPTPTTTTETTGEGRSVRFGTDSGDSSDDDTSSSKKPKMQRQKSKVQELVEAFVGKNPSLADSEDTEDLSDESSDDEEAVEDEDLEEDPNVAKLLSPAQSGDLEAVKAALEGGELAITVTNKKGETALHLAALSGSKELVAFLLEKGADVSAKTKTNDTPLHLLCNSPLAPATNTERQKAEEEIVRLLLDAPDVQVNLPDNNNNTPIILASSRGRVETVRALIKHGADVRPRNNIGATCLHAAADGGQVECLSKCYNLLSFLYSIFQLLSFSFLLSLTHQNETRSKSLSS